MRSQGAGMGGKFRMSTELQAIEAESRIICRSAKRDDCLSAFHACQECLEEAGLKEQSPPKTSAKKSALKASNKEAAGARSSSDKVGTVTGQAAVKERPSSPERTMVVAMTRAAAEVSGAHSCALEREALSFRGLHFRHPRHSRSPRF
jgi:hypothetical protein